ncbi:disintegrin and metalloproteinase domain-containing protein 2-like [Terrapene carolina triunguis]|uniref:disintegrin and metalloproteinase domain-containing protein 2-like n=1 Tax=Terrapene triunguis TaxID=2587831 RepID=UPI0011567194|nr:disintegrin and metalloproteinase domain-containing protein 2-like [Terrapene carolina triunguis]
MEAALRPQSDPGPTETAPSTSSSVRSAPAPEMSCEAKATKPRHRRESAHKKPSSMRHRSPLPVPVKKNRPERDRSPHRDSKGPAPSTSTTGQFAPQTHPDHLGRLGASHAAPRVFTKCMAVVAAFLRRHGIQVFPYLDDWLIKGRSRGQVEAQVVFARRAILRLSPDSNDSQSNPQGPQRSRSAHPDSAGVATPALDQVSYVITIEGTPYTLHLKQQLFLSDDFRVYTYTKGGAVHSDFPHIKADCYYQGYIAGFPNSLVTLSTCSGLRGLLQFENASYGIEPLDSSPGFEHIIYQIKNENTQSPLFANNYTDIGREKVTGKVSYKLHTDIESMSDVTKSPRYLEIDVILDKGLYNYLGSDKDLITEKIVQLLGFVNSMFTPLNMTIVLSSLEFWTDNNKIRTTGEADEILQRFLQWKESYLVLRPHDMAYLFVYRDHPSYVGATFAGRICLRNYAGGVALYQRAVTLETFSVIIAQLLGLSLGIAYDDSRDCQCSGYTCIMHTKAVLSNGVKAFSSCSIRDFKSFIKHRGGDCLSNRPYLNTSYKRASVCGNRIVEGGEQCDCGSAQKSTWDVTCGKLVCTYPSRIPFTKEKAAIIYAQVREHVCISLDYMKPPTENDPLLVKEGTKCGPGKVCINRTCQFYAVLGYDCNPQVKCNGHGVCNNKKHCHCNPGWNPPDCRTKGSPVGGSIDSGLRFLDSG